MDDYIEKIALGRACPKCAMPAGEPCISRTGGKTTTHTARFEDAMALWRTAYMQGGMDRLTDVITNNGEDVERMRRLLAIVMDDEGLPETATDYAWFERIVWAVGLLASDLRTIKDDGTGIGPSVEFNRENLLRLMRLTWGWLDTADREFRQQYVKETDEGDEKSEGDA